MQSRKKKFLHFKNLDFTSATSPTRVDTTMKLRLFAIRDQAGRTVPDMFFADKMAAKAKRKELGDAYSVTYGPDHRLFKHTN